MTQPLCEVCGRPLPDQAYVCSRCAEVVGQDLGRIVDLAPEVETAIAKLTKFGGSTAGGSGERPLPFDEKAGQRAAAIGNTVATWARHVSEQRGIEVPRPRRVILGPTCRVGIGCGHGTCDLIRYRPRALGVAVAAAWLVGQLEWLRHRKEGPEALGELRAAAGQLEGVVGRPPELRYRGPCWADLGELDEAGDPLRCPEILYARMGSRVVRCQACGEEHDVERRREWLLAEARDSLVHAELIARALTALGIENVTPARVRGMARHGRLVAHGHDRADRPLYRVGEVLDVIEEQARAERERAVKREARAQRKEERASRAAVA